MIIVAILSYLFSLGFSYLAFSGISWVVCWALAAAGIATIVWSWELAFFLWLIYAVLYILVGLFKN